MTRYLFLVVLTISIAGGTGQAQTLDDLRANVGAYYKFAEATDITIEVKVWGNLQYPGFYEVRQGTRLSTLVTLAGGPLVMRTSQTRRTYTIRLWRPQPNSGRHQVISETQMKDEILVLDDDPVLLSGDIVVVDELIRQRFGWRDVLSVATALGTIVLVVDTITR